jgi:hypothetical protein
MDLGTRRHAPRAPLDHQTIRSRANQGDLALRRGREQRLVEQPPVHARRRPVVQRAERASERGKERAGVIR